MNNLITAIVIATLMSGCVSNWRNMGTAMLEGAVGCGTVGVMAAKMLGKDKVKKIGGISAAVCAVVAANLEYQRQNAVSKEKEINELIEQERLQIIQLDQMNNELRQELQTLQQQAIKLESIINTNESKAVEMAAHIQNEKDIAHDLLTTIKETISKVEKLLRGSSLTSYQRKTLPGLLSLLKERKKILQKYNEISVK